MLKEKACRNCRNVIEEGSKCLKCDGNAFTTFWKGYVVVIDQEKSQIAAKMGVKSPGKYALRLSR